ncbi:MAG: N-6 DNA methylase, partial [Stellaceae bacterium]
MVKVVGRETTRKLRGAFFTPAEMVDFVVSWAVREPRDSLFEPSCGEAGFLLSAASRLRVLGSQANLRTQLHAIEIHRESAETADRVLQHAGFSADIAVGDFFDVKASPQYDAVIGNPPYVRYQQFSGIDSAKALRAALAHGVRLTQLASSWAAFTVHAAQFLKPEGRLGLVLPAELLTVNYAAEVRRFLLRRFRSVRLVMFEALVFPGVMEEVVLLLAEGSGGTRRFEIFQAKDLNDLHRLDSRSWSGFI